jgi:cobalt-precorrin 5A hydrolase / precorrin-3B C17-methyltransferase
MTIAVLVLSQSGVPIGRKLTMALPKAILYGLAKRTTSVDIHFDDFGTLVRTLFENRTAIIGLCAAGILIRTIAPLLKNKQQEPAILAVAVDGSAVVPLLGGLQGVNALAREVAKALQVSAAITTSGDLYFHTALLSPPKGFSLAAHPDLAKTFISNLIAGATVQIHGRADWLQDSQLPIDPMGSLKILVTEQEAVSSAHCLVYHPATVAIGIHGVQSNPVQQSEVIGWIEKLRIGLGLAKSSIAGIFTAQDLATDANVQGVAQYYNCPLRLFDLAEATAIDGVSAATQSEEILLMQTNEFEGGAYSVTFGIAEKPIDMEKAGLTPGQLFVVGIGPGSPDWLSPEVKQVLLSTTDWIGYTTYLDLVEPLRDVQNRHDFDNREELQRASLALDLAATGRSVALISSGDPGIYAMAAAVFEALEHSSKPSWQHLHIQVCPGISAMQAAASQIGAPLGHDFCAISLSDILKPWEIIEQRLSAAAQGDFVIAIYNPISSQRRWQLEKAKATLLHWRFGSTAVVLARKVGRVGQSIRVISLQDLDSADVDMQTIVLIGSSQTRVIQQSNGCSWVYTPRRYEQLSKGDFHG